MTAAGSVAESIAPTTNASGHGSPAPKCRAAAISAALMKTPGPGQQHHSGDGRPQLGEIRLVRGFEDERRQQHHEYQLRRDIDAQWLGDGAGNDAESHQRHGVGQVDAPGQKSHKDRGADQEYREPNQLESGIARIQAVDSPPAASTSDARSF